jgi:hypothetical protein
VIYNNTEDRNLYSISTRANDQVDLVFGDGAFTNIPIGNFRIYYRVSNNQTYKITPEEMSAVTITIPYRGRTGRAETFSVRASLEYTVTNASARETLEDIRIKAPQQYYTQNRMVTGEDYNTLPFTTFGNILKVKAVNRSSSGVSRYLDVVDATGKYSSTNIFAQDGIIYSEPTVEIETFQFTSSSEVNFIVRNVITPLISRLSTKHLYYKTATRYTPTGTWTQSLNSGGRSIGTFNASSYIYITQGALIKFLAPTGKYFDAQNQLQTGTPETEFQRTELWASVISYPTPGIGNATLSVVVPTGAEISQVIPVFANAWPSSLITEIINNVLSYKTFALRYDITNKIWTTIDEANIGTGEFDLTNTGNTSGLGLDNSWYLKFVFVNQAYSVTSRGLNYFFQSERETRFYYDPDVKVYDSRTATTKLDEIKVLRTNTLPDSANSLYYSQTYRVADRVVEVDGFEDNRKILITFPDDNLDEVPDNPDLFDILVDPETNPEHKYVFFVETIDEFNFAKYDPVDQNLIVSIYPDESTILTNITLYPVDTVFYATSEDKFYESTGSSVTLITNYIARIGRQDIMFQYTHNAPNNRRIDPSPNNLIDFYILTRTYSDQYYAFITDTSNRLQEPVPPTSGELQTEFGSIENLKTISDSIIYNPAVFKPLFGNKAIDSLRATFKVIKNPNVNLSDNDIKSQVIAAINTYFDIANWDFGETFYFSELSAYLHTALSPNVSSVIIVPAAQLSGFGSLYQINAEPNEILVSAATVDNVQIISAITAGQINI